MRFGGVVRRGVAMAAGLALLSASVGLVVLAAGPAGATTVFTEAQFRAAFTNGAETTIDLGANITVTCPGGSPDRPVGSAALTINGHGFGITDGCGSLGTLLDATNGASITLSGVAVVGNAADNGITGANSVTVIGSTITGANNNIAGIGATVTVANSTVSHAASDGIEGTNVTLTGSTVSGSGNNGVGVFGGNIVVTNSTVSDNHFEGISKAGGGSVTLVYSTVTHNGSVAGAANIEGPGGSYVFFGSVVALAQAPAVNCLLGTGSMATSHGFNLEDDVGASCGFATATSDLTPGANPILGPLANNGGTTQTRLPQPGSPLVDAIPNPACQTAPLATGITTDQRGFSRPSPPGGACDIGAVEVQTTPSAPTASVITPRFTG